MLTLRQVASAPRAAALALAIVLSACTTEAPPDRGCGPAEHDGGDGTCRALGACSPGYYDNGGGACVATGCAAAFHFGGGGCVPLGACSPGFHDNGVGTCVAASCASGYHDGGDGGCVASGTCSTGYRDDGLGACVASGCAPGYHDGGDGSCVAVGACALGRHDDGTGRCVLQGCAAGWHDGGNGTCVAAGACAPAFHDGGDGVCLSAGCSPGYHDGGGGACVAIGACSAGYHDGGAGACLATGSCSAGFHDGGDGTCRAAGSCSPGFHDDGTGACASSCAVGYHDGGAGACVATGSCSAGYHDGGAGACVATGSCSSGFHDDGTGACVASGCAAGYTLNGSGVCAPSPYFTLTTLVSTTGAGTSGYTSASDGFYCFSGQCSHSYATGTVVQITATPKDAATTFTGWSGACSGTSPTCYVTMSAARSVTANFGPSPAGSAYALGVLVSTTGAGTSGHTTASNGFYCFSGQCSQSYATGTVVQITATPKDAATAFTGWSGACSGTSPTCYVTMDAAKSVTASFGPSAAGTAYALGVLVSTTGAGTSGYTSASNGFYCFGGQCSQSYATGTVVQITATPKDAATTFTGWSGDCSGTSATCYVTISAARSVTASFGPSPAGSFYTLGVLVSTTGAGTSGYTSASEGFYCFSGQCSRSYATGAVVQLTATPKDAATKFTGWSGACSGTSPTCYVTMSAARSVTASFGPNQ